MDELQALREVSRVLASSQDVHEVLQVVLKAVTKTLGFDRAAVALVDPATQEIRGSVGINMTEEAVIAIRAPLGSNDVRATVLRSGVIQVVNGWDPRAEPEMLATYGHHSYVTIYGPLTVAGERVGVISAARQDQTLTPLSERDIDLFDLFCDYVSIALQGARLVESERKKTRRLRAVTEVMRRANQTLELNALLAETTDLLRRAFGYQRVSVMLVDEHNPQQLYRAACSSEHEETWQDLRVLFGTGMIGHAAAIGQTRLANDTSQDQHFFQAPGPHTGSELDVPLRVGSTIIGVLSIEGEQPGAFEEEDVPFVETLADQIAIAIRNSQLYGEALRQTQQLNLINSVARRMGGLMPPRELMPYLVDLLYETLVPYSVAIFLRSEREDTVVLAAAQGGKPGPMPPGTVLRTGVDGIVGRVSATGQPLLARDVEREPYFLSYPGLPLTASEMAVPIRYADEIIGVLDVQSSTRNAFDSRDIEMLHTLADQVAIAIKNARLFEDLYRRTEQIAGLHEAGQAIASSLNLDHILRSLLFEVRKRLGFDRAALALVDRDHALVRGSLATDTQGAISSWGQWQQAAPSDPGELVAQAIEGWLNSPFLADVRQREHIHNLVAGEVLRVGDQVFGALIVDTLVTRRKITDESRGVLQTFASQASIALDHARLYTELAQRAQRLAEANQQLAQLDQMKSHFLSMVSHELRTPLGLIKGYVSTLREMDATLDAATRQEFLTIIDEETDNLSELVGNLLDTSRLEAGTLALEKHPLKLLLLVRKAVGDAQQRAPTYRFALNLPQEVPLISADSRRLEQVFRNLLDNAVKYSAPGSLVTVSVVVREGEVEIKVTDEGRGIASEYQARVFERFFRVDQSDSRFGGGSGLGLSIAKGIVEGHGGRIVVESALGEGSTFTVVLPLQLTRDDATELQ
ncbi:MAG: GAF domain-containing protein [Chloroflexi bacterium]|nr:GAF domain-containing protein [Chloroflexota bacterium]